MKKAVTAMTIAAILQLAPGGYPQDLNGAQADKYRITVEKTAAMVSDPNAIKLAAKHGLNILNVTWEDTGRYKGSSVGPNISDMTIQVQCQVPATQGYRLYCMPVIRFPNFSDKSADISPEHFYLLVGNHKGNKLTKVTLKAFLQNIRSYLSRPDSWKGTGKSLLAKRDTHVLVSAQACFLPVPKKGEAQFNPVLFNYQSYKGDPAVLTILATREGTSVTIIDNVRDGFAAGATWGQRLFFNQKGERAPFTGTRLSDFIQTSSGKKGGKNPTVIAAGEKGLNMVLLIQVPLKQKNYKFPAAPSGGALNSMDECSKMYRSEKSDVEEAVIGHGKVEGPFTEIDDLEILRDDRFPIRVTVQFYKATSNGLVTAADLDDIAKQINKVYDKADYVGSLVLPGETGRPTEYDGPTNEPPGWWDSFWKLHHENTGQTKTQTMDMMKYLFGPNWTFRKQ